MPKFEANRNYKPPSPPSSMKQCNKSATVKFTLELLLTTMTRKQSRNGATPYKSMTAVAALVCKQCLHQCASKYGSRGTLNKHGHISYQSQIPLNSF